MRSTLRRAPIARFARVRPRPGPKPMRAAYLELLKLCLCDLAGARTLSVSRTGDTRRPDSQVKCRELTEQELALRARGSDWPFSGLTMVGLKRLDDLQACIESVVADDVEGDVIEAGAWRGGASILARATLDSLGAVRAHRLGRRLLPGPAGARRRRLPRGPRARPQQRRLPRRPGRGGAGPLRPLRPRAGSRARRGVLR